MAAQSSYLNPVHDRPVPDPFVLKFCGEYWCYSTGFWHDGRCFGIMRSVDLVRWREQAGAMEPLPGGYTQYWAPEVSFWNGRFYMYYSCGDGVVMQLRVAVSQLPEGPFVDCGHRLSAEEFAIDAHVFEDDDGTRYLFYATDFLEHTHIGTGTVVDRLLDPFTLAGQPRPVSRARYDWQVYDPHRLEKGGVRWHTVEGPFVLKFKGRYYQMYSGGNWQNTTYGVSYAVAPRIDALEEWEQLEHSEKRPLVLRTLPGEVIGPGHNSVVRGPDNLQLFCIYHRWADDGSGRLIAIDRLECVGDRILVLGPSTTPQPAPAPPTISGFSGWVQDCGDWLLNSESARHVTTAGDGSAALDVPFPSFVVETSFRLESPAGMRARAGLALRDPGGRSLALALGPTGADVILGHGPDAAEHAISTPRDFCGSDTHHVRLEVDGTFVRVLLDGLVRWRGKTSVPAAGVGIFASSARALFSGFAVTAGWQDLFMDGDADLRARGWSESRQQAAWELRDSQLVCRPGQLSALVKHGTYESYEAVVNVKLGAGRGASVGVMPALAADGRGPLFTLSVGDPGPVLEWRDLPGGDPARDFQSVPVGQCFRLPEHTDLSTFQHFRFRKQCGRVSCSLEFRELGGVQAPWEPTSFGLLACGTPAWCDSLRLTAFPRDRPRPLRESEANNG